MKTQFQVLVSDPLSHEGIEFLKSIPQFSVDVILGQNKESLEAMIPQYDALLVRSQTQVTKSIIQKGSQLKMIGRAGIGVDNIDIAAASTANIIVMNTPEGNIVTTAEHAIALLMSLARHIPQACASLKKGIWEKSKFKGTEIHEKVLGILGLGNIGSVVATLATGLGMRVLAYDPFVLPKKAKACKATLVTLEELYSKSDFISIHVGLTQETYHLLDESAFQKMKKGVRVINAARGGIIDEIALLNALNRGDVSGAALDVFEEEPPSPSNELLQHENVIATPHLGASTAEAQNRVGLQLAEQTRDFLLNNQIRHSVNKHVLSNKLPNIAQHSRHTACSGNRDQP
jgi:D-3-phosphoglycerate dehydrogenase / 2-oxoglutarate reductase